MPKPEITFLPILDATETQIETIRMMRNLPEIRSKMYTDHEIAANEHRRWLESLRNDSSQHVMMVMQGSNPIGVVSLTKINIVHKTATWAFYLIPRLHGSGLGAAVEFNLIDLAFRDFSLEKLNCEVLANNEGVIRIHKKFGFVQEGVLRKNIVKKESRIDVYLLGLLKEEWLESREKMERIVRKVLGA